MQSWITDYIAHQHRALESIDVAGVVALVDQIRVAHREDRQIFICGNGGSAANASHFATDLGKGASDAFGQRFRVLSLNDNAPWITALGNDYAFEDIFVRQLENYGRAGDLLITASVSGGSPNLVKALEWARANGLRTVALVGAKRGRTAELAEHVIAVGDTHYGRVEDVQMHVLHMAAYAFMEPGALEAA
jgi:D-sedoheptulose 7-phosphate isomerase